jgi:hypothetical protein
MTFPTLVYRDKGPHYRIGGTYDYRAVPDQAAFDAALADGWCATLGEIVDGKPVQAPADDAPATREELEAKATELGLKFDGRTNDKKLSAMITEALAV